MRFLPLALVVVVAGCAAPPAAPPPLAAAIQSPSALESAIARSQTYLLSYEATHFVQPPEQNDRAGVRREAFVAFALLSSGVSADDPMLVPLLAFIEGVKNPDPYVRGLRLRILGLLWPQRHDPAIQNLALADPAALVQSVHVGDPLEGLWSAADDPAGPFAEAANPREITADFFATESALAGLSAAAQLGANIPNGLWLIVQQRLRYDQCPDGGWSDINPPAPTGVVYAAITLANLHSLQIIRAYLAANVKCDGNVNDDAIENAIEWVGKHFDEFDTPSEYWAIEQIATISGFRYFNRTDWFAAIAPRVMNLAGPGEHNGIDPVVAESLHLLFLSHGSAPVAMTKLDYSTVQGHRMQDANWDERPLDIFNLTHWAGDQAESTLSWRVANLATPIDDLHDSPILYLAGDQIIRLSDADVAKLRQFVIEGGLILGNADCNSSAFKNSFIQLGQRMFPRYEFYELGRDDLILTGEAFRKFRSRPEVVALSNGVRELMLLFPTGDPARAWQSNGFLANPDAFQLGSDVLQYATDSAALRPLNDSYIVRPDPTIKPTRTIRLARLMVGENPDPEPGGWPRLAAILRNDYRIDLQVSAVKPGESLAGFQIVHFTGTTAFHFTPAERQVLVEFTRHGGTLIIDAAGGAGSFADAARKELVAMFGNGAGYRLTWLSPGSLLYTLPQAPIGQVEYRRFARRTLVGDATTPRIFGVELGGRCVAFFSPFDLSAGLVGERVDGVNGYSPGSATALMRNMILYAASAPK